MGQDLYRKDTYARQVFDQVEKALGFDVAALCFESDEATLKQTQNAQIALYTCGLAAFYAFRGANPHFKFSAAAGHSVGEYTALAAAGVLSVQTGAVLVRRRGELMAEAGKDAPGTMAAVIGMDAKDLQDVVDLVGNTDCVIANDNSPGQLVISGAIDAVQAVSVKATESGAKRVIPLSVSGAFHSPLMDSASKELGVALSQADFAEGEIPVYSNVLAAIGKEWPMLLQTQLKGQVRWRESMIEMRKAGIETFIEFGVGEVLTGLMRRIDKDAKTSVVMDTATLAEATEMFESSENS